MKALTFIVFLILMINITYSQNKASLIIGITSSKGKVSIYWDKPMGLKYESFYIEKGVDTLSFRPLSNFLQETNKETSFSITDLNPIEKGAYYRLKLIKDNGQTIYSSIKFIKCERDNSIMQTSIVSSIVFNEFIDINFVSTKMQNYTMQVYTGSGNVIYTHERKCKDGLNQIKLAKKYLANGIYYVVLNIENKKLTEKVIVSR